MTTLDTNITIRNNRDDRFATDARIKEFAEAMLPEGDYGQGVEKKDNAGYLAELFGTESVVKDPVVKETVEKDPVDGDAILDMDTDVTFETREAGDAFFFNDGEVAFEEQEDVTLEVGDEVGGEVVFDDRDDVLLEFTDDAVVDDADAVDDELIGEEADAEVMGAENQVGTESYDSREPDNANGDDNPVFGNFNDGTNLENTGSVPTGAVYPNVGSTLTGPSGQMSWGALHDKVVRDAGDGWLELDELTALGLSDAAAQAILAGDEAVPASVLMDTFAAEARLRGGMPVSITDQGIDEALNALIHANGPLRSSFDSYAPEGFIAKEDFITLAREATAYVNEPTPSTDSLGQLFDEIAGGNRRMSEFEFNNLIASTDADGMFSFEDAGLSISEQLAALGPPLTDRWLDNDQSTNEWRNDNGRPAYTFGSSNSIRIGEFRQAAESAMDRTGEYLRPSRVTDAFQTISAWDGRSGLSERESRWAFGSNPTAWDIIDGIRANSTPRWEPPSWSPPQPNNTSWWRKGW